MKLFSTKVHGALDYVTVAILPTLPRALGWENRLTRFLDGAAAGVLAYSLLTRYELGALKILPMRGHLCADAIFGTTMLSGAASDLSGGENKAAKAVLVGLGLFALLAAVVTETE